MNLPAGTIHRHVRVQAPTTPVDLPPNLPVVLRKEAKEAFVAQVRELAAQGKSRAQIEDELFGYRGGYAYSQVRAALED